MNLSCRERRLFCDRKYPCTQCTAKGKECVRPSGLAQAKSFSRRIAYNTPPSKRIRTGHEEQIPVSPRTSDDEHQDRDQAPTPAVSDNLFLHPVTDPIQENFAQPISSLAPAPVAPIKYGISLMTRVITSREVRHICESECPTLALFLEQVRKLWNLTVIERITHIQIMITVKMGMAPMVQVIDIGLDKLSQWDLAMEIARQNDMMAVAIVEIS